MRRVSLFLAIGLFANVAQAQQIPLTGDTIEHEVIGVGAQPCSKLSAEGWFKQNNPNYFSVVGWAMGYFTAEAKTDVMYELRAGWEGFDRKLEGWARAPGSSARLMNRLQSICGAYPQSSLSDAVAQLEKEINSR